jgi:hypothetical protein
MAGDSEITKRMTRLMKSGDKLIQDIKRDAGQLLAAANGVKEIITDIKNNLKGPKDSS